MFCPRCGKQAPQGAYYCPECGNHMGAAPAGAPAPPFPKHVQDPGAGSYAAPHAVSGGHGRSAAGAGTRDQHLAGRGLIYPRNPPLSPHVAWITLLIVGVPQLMHGQVLKGILLFIVFWLSFVTIIGPLLVLVAALIDAYMVGSALKAGKPISPWSFFPAS